ncbi:FAS1 domain-containing protein [Crassisporium funariophilum]|nr:FAS1 domain-containing protein [Crassisporium funariophilum]
MHLSSLPLSLLLPLIPLFTPTFAQQQNATYLQDLMTALQSAGFSELANATMTINSTANGQAILSQISQGNFTVFAPTDAAFRNLSSDISGNSTRLAEYLSYHFVYGGFQNASYTNTSSSGGGGGAGGGVPTTTSTEIASSTETSSVLSTASTTSTSTSTVTQSTSTVTSSEVSTATTTSGTTATASATATVTATAALFERLFGRQSSGGSSNSGSNPQPYAGVYPNITLGRTLLNATEWDQLEGNKSQALAWTRSGDNGNVTILNQAQNITVINSTIWQNLFINGINGVLIPPGNVTTALTATNATTAQSFISSIQVPSLNGTNETATQFLQDARGFTLFVPHNDAFTTSVNQTLDGLRSNQTALAALLMNHYINGTTIYSPSIVNNSSPANETTAAGDSLSFITNTTGTFISAGNGSTAQIVRPDVLISNGVIHIIDRVLIDEDSNPSVASSA